MDASAVENPYGELDAERQWYNVFSWRMPEKFALYCGALGSASFVAYNRYWRRPWYAGMLYGIPTTLGLGAAGYALGKYREYMMRNRDAVIAHYMSLHPDDFSTLKSTGRHWRDVLLPWQPVRYYESPYKWVPEDNKKDSAAAKQ